MRDAMHYRFLRDAANCRYAQMMKNERRVKAAKEPK
jgi:hypothetical protein